MNNSKEVLFNIYCNRIKDLIHMAYAAYRSSNSGAATKLLRSATSVFKQSKTNVMPFLTAKQLAPFEDAFVLAKLNILMDKLQLEVGDKIMTPLYGYSSEEASYLVNSYPYGNKRCRIRFWLERDAKRGFRFVSQTENPTTFRWNAPKKSTYAILSGCMFLDDKNHVVWNQLHEFSSAPDILSFIKDFPGADLSFLRPWILGKQMLCRRTISGKGLITINGETKLPSQQEIELTKQELATWATCLEHLNTIIGAQYID